MGPRLHPSVEFVKQGPIAISENRMQAIRDLIESGMSPGKARMRVASMLARERLRPGLKLKVKPPEGPQEKPPKKPEAPSPVQKGWVGLVDFIKKSPPNMEHMVRKLKRRPGVDNPWAVAWSMHRKMEKKAVRVGDISFYKMLEKAVDLLVEARGTAPLDGLALLSGADEVNRIVGPPSTGLWAWRTWNESDLHYTGRYGPDRIAAALALIDRPYGVRV